jgi:hypothetical protein
MLQLLRARLAARTQAVEPEQSEQRRHRRHSVLMKATVYPIDLYRDAIIHNASQTGLMGEADIELEVGQTVHVSLNERDHYTAVVRWAHGRQFGLDLQDELELAGLSEQIDHGSAVGHGPRAERIHLGLPARLHTGQSPRPAVVRNLSRTGMLLEAGSGLLPGQQILIRVGGWGLISGRVQWSGEDRIGIRTKVDVPILQMLYQED